MGSLEKSKQLKQMMSHEFNPLILVHVQLLKSDEHYMLATPDHYNGIELGLLPMQQMQGLESNA